jgi:hypothetical protein
MTALNRLMNGSKTHRSSPPKPMDTTANVDDPIKGFVAARKIGTASTSQEIGRTLQRDHGGPHKERIEYMELHSALASKDLAVSLEQVSIFLTADNTIISFFESAADDIEVPILARLASAETILRRSCDARMMA